MMQMVEATSQIASRSGKMGIDTTVGAAGLLGRAAASFGGDLSESARVAAGKNALDIMNNIAADTTLTPSALEFASRTQNRWGSKAGLSELVAMKLDLTEFGDLNRQGLGAGTNDITDQGEDPTGPPIQVPDGLWFLLTMALSYIFWIRILKNKLKKSED